MNTEALDKEYLKSLTILYVEDEAESCILGSSLISKFCKKVITADNGEEGLNAYLSEKPDIVITDMQMPVMDGLTMARGIRELDRWVHFYCSWRDVSLAKENELALRERERISKLLIEESPLPQALYDKAGKINYLNHQFIATFGYTLDDIPTIKAWMMKAYRQRLGRYQVAAGQNKS
jgi:CheY-like chemotaxis protein